MARPTFTVSDYLIARLRQLGCQHLFAVPGDYASSFLESVDATRTIKRVANVNELGSGYAADGYARFRGVGAACVQYGVGTFSLLNCTAGSYVERVPVVVISASPSTKDRRITRQEGVLFHHSTGNLLADRDVFANVTVASEVIRSAAHAPERIDRALVEMLTYKRPIYLEFLQNVWDEECARPRGRLRARRHRSDPPSLAAAVAAALARLQEAASPVIWAGVEVQRFGLADTLQELVDASGLPFTTTSLGKTVLDEDQRQFVGTYAGPASPEITRKAMGETGCPLAIGTIITDDYLDIMGKDYGEMIEVTDEEVRVGYQHYRDVWMGDFLETLVAEVKADPAFPREVTLPKKPEPPLDPDPSHPLSYNVFFHELTRFLEREDMKGDVTLVLGESTSLYVWGNLFGWRQNGFVGQAAWGSLGFETGAALGVQLGSRTRAFVIAGDGGFRMVCQELSSMAEAKANPVIFVMANDAYAIEQAFVDSCAFTEHGEFAAFDLLPKWDYGALARAFGAAGFSVATVGQLRKALHELRSIRRRPALVEVRIPQKDLAPQLARLAPPCDDPPPAPPPAPRRKPRRRRRPPRS